MTNEIGTLANAARALDAFKGNDRTFLLSTMGTTRFVYLIDNVVYKVELGNSDSVGANSSEFDIAKDMRDNLPEGYAIPDMTLYRIGDNDILAMEYISGIETGECFDRACGFPCEGDHVCFSDDIADKLRSAGWVDLAMGNAIIAEDATYLVDVA